MLKKGIYFLLYRSSLVVKIEIQVA